MQRGDRSYRLYVEYWATRQPSKVRTLDSMLNRKLNGLANAIVDKWQEKMIRPLISGGIRVNEYGETRYI